MKKALILLCLLTSSIAHGASNTNSQNTSTWDGVTPRVGVTINGAKIIAAAPSVQIGPRLDCIFINTSMDTMYLDFGVTATAGSIAVKPLSTVSCVGSNSINQDYISLFSTSAGDSYYLLVTVLKAF